MYPNLCVFCVCSCDVNKRADSSFCPNHSEGFPCHLPVSLLPKRHTTLPACLYGPNCTSGTGAIAGGQRDDKHTVTSARDASTIVMGCEMSRLCNLRIALDNGLAVYQPRDLVVGTVLADVSDDLVVHSGQLWFSGNADVISQSHENDQTNVTQSSHQCFFHTSLNLLQDLLISDQIIKLPEGSGFILTKGLHRFQFEFELPADIPSSFDASSMTGRAQVRYRLRVEFENRQHSVNHSCERDFLVLRPFDLNQCSYLKDGVTLQKEFSISCCCIKRGGIVSELSVDKTGFVPGETMQVKVFIRNASSTHVKTTTIHFQQVVTLKFRDQVRSTILTVYHMVRPRVSAGSAVRYLEPVHIPPLAPSGLQKCSIIDVDYRIQTTMKLGGMLTSNTDTMIMTLPIIIGSIPLRDASFLANEHVVPCYASFNYENGDISEHDPHVAFLKPCFTYFKSFDHRRLSPRKENGLPSSMDVT